MGTKPRRSCAGFHEPAKFADSLEKVRHESKYQPSADDFQIDPALIGDGSDSADMASP
jgi:hypothetical protein